MAETSEKVEEDIGRHVLSEIKRSDGRNKFGTSTGGLFTIGVAGFTGLLELGKEKARIPNYMKDLKGPGHVLEVAQLYFANNGLDDNENWGEVAAGEANANASNGSDRSRDEAVGFNSSPVKVKIVPRL